MFFRNIDALRSGLQMGYHFVVKSVSVVGFHCYLLFFRDVDVVSNGLQIGYRFGVKSVGLVSLH